MVTEHDHDVPEHYLPALSHTHIEILQSALTMYMERMQELRQTNPIISRYDILKAVGAPQVGNNPSYGLIYAYAAQHADAKALFDELTKLVGYDTTQD